MLDPVKNSSPSDKCANPIGSDCVLWAGGTPPGLSLCKGATLTQVINQVAAKASDAGACCSGSFPPGHASCYTGSWVDFSAAIPLSGTGVGYSYAISGMGFSGKYTPQYKWEPNGDLIVRGAFLLSITPTIIQGGGLIPLATLPTSCFPSGWTADSDVLIAVYDNKGDNSINQSASYGLFLDYPSGILYIAFEFINFPLSPFGKVMTLNTHLNIA